MQAVSDGRLHSGQVLPSIRSLATSLDVSPGTVALAFRTLRERGIITSTHGRRSRIADRPALPQPQHIPLPPGIRDLSTSSPDPELLPDVGRLLNPEIYLANVLYDTPLVEPSLHEVMSAQFAADGIVGDLSTVNGALDGLERILTTHLRPGDTVVVEDPQWMSSLALLRTLGLDIAAVPVDEEGLRPEALREVLGARRCSALLITTRAQNPYGSALSEQRAAELREILTAKPEILVIEDDHASLIAGAPPATLTTGRAKWAVIRSMSKAIGPDLRVAVMASDRPTADRVQGRLMLGPGWVSHLAQRLVAAVLRDADAMAQIAVAEQTYTARRNALIDALADRGIEATGRSGLNVLIPVTAEAALSGYLITQGWALRPGEGFRLATPPFLRVSIATLQQADAVELAEAFARGLGNGNRRRGV